MQTIDRFAEASFGLPLSYDPVGMAGAPPEGYNDLDETIVSLGEGQGEAVFERAKAARPLLYMP